MIGNRIFYGCDDCQLVCLWNRFARQTDEPDFCRAQQAGPGQLVELFGWSEAEFQQRLAGTPIYRIGHGALAAQYRRWAR